MEIVLTAVEARVLGSLLEKERTVPGTYPLTLKALVSACNQTSSRDPLMDLSEADVEAAVEALKAHRLVRKVLPSHGNRSVKYRHVAVEALTVDEPQRAIITVLLLRGPQTPQELRTRTERLHAFADAEAVEEVLADMARWGDPLVRLLPRRPGQRDARWAHLLSGEPDLSAPDPVAPPPRSAPAPAAPPPPEPEAVHGALAALAGTWTGDGDAIEVVPRPGEPVLAWRAEGGGEVELGFLRLIGDDEVELVVASASGRAERWRGLVEVAEGGGAVELVLSSDRRDRSYRATADTLTTDVASLTRA